MQQAALSPSYNSFEVKKLALNCLNKVGYSYVDFNALLMILIAITFGAVQLGL